MSYKIPPSISSGALRPTPPTGAKSSILKLGNGDQLKLGITSSSSQPSADNSSFVTFTQDISMVMQKIADLSGEAPASTSAPPTPIPAGATSTFVSGLRSLTNVTTSDDTLYAQHMEKLIGNMRVLIIIVFICILCIEIIIQL